MDAERKGWVRTGVPQSRGRLPARMPASAGSVRGHVTAAIRALRADARLPPRLLAGRARSPRPASPSHELAAAAAARAPGCTMTGTRRSPLPQRFSPHTRPSAPGELPAGRRPPRSCRLAAAGRAASCVSRCPAAPGARAAVPTRSAAEGPPPGSAWALRRSPRSCFRLLALPPARTVKGGRSSCGGLRRGGEPAPRGRPARSPERGGVAGRRPYSPPAGASGKGRLRGGHAGGPGPAPRPSVPALAASPSLFLGLWGWVAVGTSPASAPGKRDPRGGKAPAHLLQGVRATRRVCPRGPQTVLLSLIVGLVQPLNCGKIAEVTRSSAISGRV